MASKRKSTTPCMIPSKRLREELEQEPPVLVRQGGGGGGRQSPLDLGVSSKTESPGDQQHGNNRDGAGTYTCRPCNFETHDLNLFLDHVYSGHPDFRADPSFLCVDCGASAAKFEGLALHNARVHPSTFNTTLQLRKRDRKVVVEQHLVMGTDAAGKDAEISITKTPIMRMLKGKFESRRIAVPHAASDEELHSAASRDAEKKETPAVTVTHVPTIVHNGATTKVTLPSAIQIVNGSGTLPMLKTAMTQVVSVVQNRTLQQTSPITVSSTSLSSAQSHHTSSKNLPKVMIPLSSIPTYSASMDSSSFLKTSFSKFPYPTKAELCYLTVVTKFPEEQIKIWFTAQRLKQGISWSPEEIDEARRKMFNTIIQTAPPSAQHQRQNHHGAHLHNHHHHQQQHAQHTFTVLPAQLGPTGIPHILQGSLVSQGGVIVTQPMTMTNGIQVTSAPVALAVTPKPQAAARPMMQARPAAALVADKGVSMVVGTVGSSSSGGGINVISSSNSSRSGAGSSASSIISSSGSSSNSNSSSSISSHASVINLSLGYSNHHHSNTNGKVSSVNGKPGGGKASGGDKSNSAAKDGCEKKNNDINNKTSNTSTTNKSNSESKVLNKADVKSSTDSKPSDGSSNGSKSGSNSGQKSKDVISGSNKSNTTSTASVPTSTAPPNTPTPPTPTTSNSPGLKIEAASSPAPKSASPSPAAAAAAPSTGGGAPSSRASLPNTFLDPSFYKGKKSQEQLAALKDSFVVNQFPNQEEVDRLISLTGLTVREVRKWFSDRRYHFRNLKGSKTTTPTTGEKTPKSGSAAAGTPGSGKSASGSGASETPMDLSDSGSSAGSKTTQQASGGAAKAPKQDSSAPKTPQQVAASSAPLSPPPSQTPTSPSTPSRRPPRPPSPDFTAIRYKEREPHQVRALEASFAQEADPSGEEVDRLRAETKMTRREIHGWFADKRKRAAAEKKKEEAERAVREEEDMLMEVAAGGAGLGAGAVEEEKQRGEDCSSGEPKVNPIKINLKMLKVTEANGKPEGEGSDSPAASPPPPSSTPKPAPSPSSSSATPPPPPVPKPSPSPKPSPAVRGKKTAEQLHLLKRVYARTQWPSAPQYDDMISGTGLARPEVVRWFGDCRYVQKNGTLKWLEEYQAIVHDEDCGKGDVQVLQAHLDANDGALDESQVVELAKASNLTEELVRHWFSIKAAAATAALSLDKDTAAAADRTGSDSEAAPPASDRTEASEAAPPVSSDRTGSEATPPGSSDRTGASEAAPPPGSDRTGASEAAPPGSSDRLGSEAAALLDSDRTGASKAAPPVSDRTGSEEAASPGSSNRTGSDAAPLGSTPESQQGSKGECGSSSSSSSSPPGEEEPQQGEVKEENIEQSVCGGSTKKAQEEKQSDKTVNPTKGTD